MKTIVVLGGGFSGIATANHLARTTKRLDTKVLLIEPKEENVYEPDFVFWPFRNKPFSKLVKPLDKILNKRVNWLRTEATKIEPKNQKLILKNGEELRYDYLVLTTGARMAEEQIRAICGDNVCHFYTPDGVKKLKVALQNFKGGTIVITPTTVPYKCPPAPIEFTFLLDKYLRKKGLRDKTTIKFLYPLSRAFTMAEPAKKVEQMFEKRDIQFTSFFNYDHVDKEKNTVYSLEGEEIEYTGLIIVPPHVGQDVIIESGLGDKEGWIKTDRYTLKHTEYNNIYALGDGTDLPVSKSGAVAHFSSNILVKNLVSEIKGKEPKAKYKGLTICFIVTSFNKSMLLHFNYAHPPRKYGLHSTLLFGFFKKAFKSIYFKLLIKGYL